MTEILNLPIFIFVSSIWKRPNKSTDLKIRKECHLLIVRELVCYDLLKLSIKVKQLNYILIVLFFHLLLIVYNLKFIKWIK